MNGGQRNTGTFEALATILGGAFLINYAVLLLWFLVFLFAPESLFALNTKWFVISRHEFDLLNYCGMAVLKIINLAFFLCPFLSIKFWLRTGQRG